MFALEEEYSEAFLCQLQQPTTTLTNLSELKPGSILMTTHEAKHASEQNSCVVNHTAIYVPAKGDRDAGVIHITAQDGMVFHELNFYVKEILYPKTETENSNNLIVFTPEDEELGHLVAEQADAWYQRDNSKFDPRSVNIMLEQHHLLENIPPFDLLDSLKMALRRDTGYSRIAESDDWKRGTNCLKFVADCYNAVALGRYLDEKVPDDKFTCNHNYTSVKYAHERSGEEDTYAGDQQRQASKKRSQQPKAYEDKGKRAEQSWASEELTLPSYADAGVDSKKAYDRHIRVKSPVDYLPKDLQIREVWKEMCDVIPLRINAKYTTSARFCQHLLESKHFKSPCKINVDIEQLKQKVTTDSKKKAEQEKIQNKDNRSAFWQNYKNSLHIETLWDRIIKLECSLHPGLRFNSEDLQDLKVYFQEPKLWIEFIDKLLDVQEQFKKQVKDFKKNTLNPLLNEVVRQKGICPTIRSELASGLPEKGAQILLEKAIEAHPGNQSLQQIHQHVKKYIEFNTVLRTLYNRIRLIGPCRLFRGSAEEAEHIETITMALRMGFGPSPQLS